MGSLPGPWTHDVEKIDIKEVPITALREYRELFVPDGTKNDSAGMVVANLSSLAGCQTEALLGGHWTKDTTVSSWSARGLFKSPRGLLEIFDSSESKARNVCFQGSRPFRWQSLVG